MKAGEVVPMCVLGRIDPPVGHHRTTHPRPHTVTGLRDLIDLAKSFPESQGVAGAVLDLAQAHLGTVGEYAPVTVIKAIIRHGVDGPAHTQVVGSAEYDRRPLLAAFDGITNTKKSVPVRPNGKAVINVVGRRFLGQVVGGTEEGVNPGLGK